MKFAAFKNARVVRSGWLEKDGRRLDCGPYMSGALEAKDALDRLDAPKMELREVTTGIFHAGREGRQWVDSPDYGVPFLGSTAILQADLSRLPLISKRQVAHNPLLTLEKNWSLITRSGTVGRMAYVRPDIAGMACSEDVLRVVPNESKIPPGYVYAFLSSRYGVPLIVAGTYGAIIQHIEPHHIAELPVPRFEESFEGKIGRLMQEAAEAITQSSQLVHKATSALLQTLGLTDLRDDDWHNDTRALGWGETGLSSESLRSLNYDPRVADVRHRFEENNHSKLGDLCDPQHFRGKTIFTRVDADPEHGVMLLGQRNAFHLRPEGRWISKRSIAGLGLQVPPGTTLIPSHGTLGEFELYCRALIVTQRTSRYAFSGDFFRCIPLPGLIEPGYLFAFLRSRLAFRMLRSISTGGKQQEQHAAMMHRFPIPRLDHEREAQIGNLVYRACTLHDQGIDYEDKARGLVEDAIGGNNPWPE